MGKRVMAAEQAEHRKTWAVGWHAWLDEKRAGSWLQRMASREGSYAQGDRISYWYEAGGTNMDFTGLGAASTALTETTIWQTVDGSRRAVMRHWWDNGKQVSNQEVGESGERHAHRRRHTDMLKPGKVYTIILTWSIENQRIQHDRNKI